LPNKPPSTYRTMPWELVSAHARPFSACTLGGESQHSQTQVVVWHKLPPLGTHSIRHSSHPFDKPESFSHKKARRILIASKRATGANVSS
jgi:hypothetical protein